MDNKAYLKAHLQECFMVVDSCLSRIYNCESYMYRPLAGQLRILWCDYNRKDDVSLLPTLCSEIKIKRLRPIVWSDKGPNFICLNKCPLGTNRIAMMPFIIFKYTSGLVVADFQYSNAKDVLDLKSWIEQPVNFFPTPVSIKEVVRHVADKGGGAHVDKNPSYKLSLLSQLTPVGISYAEAFILALGRLTQQIGEKLLGYEGCKVSSDLLSEKHNSYECMMVVHADLAEELGKR